MLESLKDRIQETNKEELWNTLSHSIGLLLSIIGTPILFYYNQHITFLVHGVLFFMFLDLSQYT